MAFRAEGIALCERRPADATWQPFRSWGNLSTGGPSLNIEFGCARFRACRSRGEASFTHEDRAAAQALVALFASGQTQRFSHALDDLQQTLISSGEPSDALGGFLIAELGITRVAVLQLCEGFLAPIYTAGYGELRPIRPRAGSPLAATLESGAITISGEKQLTALRRAYGARSLVLLPIDKATLVLADCARRPIEESLQLRQALCRVQNAARVAWRIRTAERRSEELATAVENAVLVRDGLLSSIGVGVVATGPDGNIEVWNPRAQEVFGVSAEEARGKPLARLVMTLLDEPSADRLLDGFETALDSGLVAQVWQQLIIRADGKGFCLNMVISPLPHAAPCGVAVVLEDVTDLVSLEADMDRMRHLAQVGQLTAQIAHELRNPLTSIRGAAQILEHSEPEGQSAEFVKIILEEVHALNVIADEFLEFARPTRLNLEPLRLNEAVTRSAALWMPHCRENGVRLRTRFDPRVEIVWADSGRLNQVLRNLILNGIQAMPNGGTLSLATKLDCRRQQAVVAVKDTGVGMTEQQVERALEPFFTTKTKGTGLGLSITEKLVKAHGGTMNIKSELGKGTVFEVRLSALEPVQ